MKPRSTKTLRKPSKDDVARVRKYVDSMDWKFAKSMPQWPHWYVLREDGRAREFDFVNALIKKFGYPDLWGNGTKHYLAFGKFKYWIEDNVLNRAAPISNAEVRRRGDKWLARHGMKSGPYGRPIIIKKKRRKI